MKTAPTSLTCPSCGQKFSSSLVVDFEAAAKDSDFCPLYVGDNPLPNMLHLCPSCGFIGFQADFAPIPSDELRQNLHTAIAGFGYQKDESIDGAERYRRAAVFALYLGKSNVEIAELYLQATWCSRLAGEPDEMQARARKKAIDYFERALAAEEFGPDDQPVAHYLLGELNRRVGDEAEAIRYFDSVEEFPKVDPLIRELRDEQRASIRRGAISDEV